MPRATVACILALVVAAVAMHGSNTPPSASSEHNSPPSAWKADFPPARPRRSAKSNPLIVPPNPFGDKQSSSDDVEALRSGLLSGLDVKDEGDESSHGSLLESWADSQAAELPEQREEGGGGGRSREQQLSASTGGRKGGFAREYIAGLPRDDWTSEADEEEEEEDEEGEMEEEEGGMEDDEGGMEEEEGGIRQGQGEEEEEEEEGSDGFSEMEEHLSHYQRSLLELERGHVEGAQRELREAISINGNDAEALTLLGAIAAARGKPDRAALLFQQALAVEPGCVAALCYEGQLLECHHHNILDAEERYRRAAALAPAAFAPHAALASLLHFRLSDPHAAAQSYRQAISLMPSAVRTRVDAAKLFLAQGEAPEALDILAPALLSHPAYPPLLRAAAHARWQAGEDKAEALALAAHAVALAPGDAAGLCDHAFLLADTAGEWEASAELYEKAMAAAPSDPVPLRELGLMRQRQGAHAEEAAALLQKALALAPSDPSALSHYATLLHGEEGRYEEADECYAKALEETPNDPAILSSYALMLGGKMLMEEASPARTMILQRRSGELLERAVAVHPSGGVLQYNLAAHYDKVRHDYDKAKEHYHLAVRCNDAIPDAYFRLGYVLQYHLRDYGEAEAAYQGCLLAQPLHLEAMANYGLLLCNPLKRYHSARRVLGRVLELAPHHDDARLGLKFLQLLDNAQRRQATEEPTSE